MAGAGEEADNANNAEAQRVAARERFAALAHRPEREVDLAEGALLIAVEDYPALDIAAYLGKLDRLAQRVRQRIADSAARASPPDADEAALAALHGVLFDEEGFAGAGPDPEDYYHPRNSFLNEVLDRKRGLPITLSVVYCEVARRAGLEAVGINLPGHFIAQFRGQHLSVLVDPFNRGARLRPQDCAELVRRGAGQLVELAPGYLVPAPPKQILVRILENLKVVYIRRRQLPKALAAVERQLVIGQSIGHVRDRGIILREMNLPDLAWFDLKLYARLAADAPDAAAINESADQLWMLMGRHN